MKIEEGKFYRTRDGRKVGPMREDSEGDFDVQEHEDMDLLVQLWRKDGKVWNEKGGESDHYLIAEWTDEPDTPKTWGEMTDAEQRDVSHAAMKGKTIELDAGSFGWAEWDGETPLCLVHHPIRIKPEPKRETVTIDLASASGGKWYQPGSPGSPETHRITFDTIDGKPATGEFRNDNGDVIKMEELK